MRDKISSVVDVLVPSPRPPLPTDAMVGLQRWYEPWPWVAVACVGVLILSHLMQVRGLRRQLRNCQISLRNFQSEGAALKQKISELEAAEAARKERQSKAAQWYAENDVRDLENQAQFIEQSVIKKRNVLNREELAIFRHCLTVVRELRLTYRCNLNVCPQVSMGEALRTLDDITGKTFACFNAKRIDILICNDTWQPLVAIEHQGSGHTLSDDSAERDRVKARALERAGVLLIETRPEHCADLSKEFQAVLKTKLLEMVGMA